MTKQHQGRFSIVPARAVEDRRLGSAGFRVLAALGTFSDKHGWCWPSLTTLATQLSTRRQVVQRHVQELAKLGYIEIQHQNRSDGGNAANRYRLLFDRALFQVGIELRGVHREGAGGVHREGAGGVHREGATPATLRGLPLDKNYPKEHIYGSSAAERFDGFWRIYPSRRPHSNPKKPAREKFEAALKRGVPASVISRGAENYAVYVEQETTDPRYIAQAVTWLNQERWAEYQEALEEVRPEVAPL